MQVVEERSQQIAEQQSRVSNYLENMNKRQQETLRLIYTNKPTVSLDMFQPLGVDPSFDGNVRQFDTSADGRLRLYHYLDPLVKETSHVRGIVVDSNNNIVCSAIPFIPEVREAEFESMDAQPYAYTNAFEGTLIRLFFHNDVWYVSTNKKINGRNSRWACRPFGELWNECMTGSATTELDYDKYFNRSFYYIFLMCHPENAFIGSNTQPRVFFLASNDTNVSEMYYKTEALPISYQDWFSGTNKEDYLALVRAQSYKEASGLIVCCTNAQGVPFTIKLVSDDYYHRKELRGNEPNLGLRYMQLMYIRNSAYAQELVDLYPERFEYFRVLESQLNYDLVHYIYDRFVHRYVHNNYDFEQPYLHTFISDIAAFNPSVKNGVPLDEQTANNVKQQIAFHLLNVNPNNVNKMLKDMRKVRKILDE